MPMPPAPAISPADREVEQIVRALRERGSSSRAELSRAVNARRWGPGRFGQSLRVAQEQGQARRVARARYEAAAENARRGASEGSSRGDGEVR
jgi:hypothetical protein